MTDRPPMFDDRRFPDLVQQARAALRRRLAESGAERPITSDEDALLTATALLVDHLHDRLAHLGERLRGPLLEVLGVAPRPSRAARAIVRFEFAGPLARPLDIPAGTAIGAVPSTATPFTTVRAVRVTPARVIQLAAEDGLLLVGLSEPAGGTLVELAGDGLDGGAWDCWDGQKWRSCRSYPAPASTVRLDVPSQHEIRTLAGHEAAWLRRQTPGPLPARAEARTLAVIVPAVHARLVEDEPLGISDGGAGQRFRLAHQPTTIDGAPPVVETSTGDGWQEWAAVESFAAGGPGDRQVVFDAVGGEVRFPPAIVEPDGTRHESGPVPEAGALVRIRGYWVGGGAAGNVAPGALRVLLSPLPGVQVRVENQYAARGGCDATTEADLWRQVPGLLSAGDRAVTPADHEELARRAEPSLARVHCVADEAAQVVRVLLVPALPPGRESRPSWTDLRPPSAMLAAVRDHLEPRRLLGARLHVEPPSYQGVCVSARIVADPGADRRALRAAVTEALYAFLHPVTGGDGGAGWAFGQAVQESAVKKLLYGVPGVQDFAEILLHPVDARTGAQSAAQPSIALIATALPISVAHRVEIVGD
jgi:hypothetical protein